MSMNRTIPGLFYSQMETSLKIQSVLVISCFITQRIPQVSNTGEQYYFLSNIVSLMTTNFLLSLSLYLLCLK